MLLWDFISISVVGMVMYPFLRFTETKDFAHVVYGIGMLLTDVITKGLKHISRDINYPDIFLRPTGAYNCDIFCRDGNREGQPGMPSGHAALATFFAFYFYKYQRHPFPIVFVLPLLVYTSRYKKNCHNPVQLVAGGLVGALTFLSLKILMKFMRL